MSHTDGQHNRSHFSETLRHKKEPTCLKLLSMADGSGDQAPKPHCSNELRGKSFLIPLWHLSCLGRCPGLTRRFFSAVSSIIHPATSATAAGLLWKMRPLRASILFHLRWAVAGREGGKWGVRKQEGWEGGWWLTQCLSEGFASLYGSLGSSCAGFLCLGPILQLKQSGWEWRLCKTLRGERLLRKRQGMREHKPNPCSVIDRVVTAKPSAGYRAAGMCFRWASISLLYLRC